MHKKNQSIPILISGTIGTGKSTLAKHLAKTMKRKYISASDIYRRLLEKKLQSRAPADDPAFWEKQGKKANALRKKDHSFDKQVDREVLRMLHLHPNAVSDAHLAPWMYKKKAIRIWIHVSDKEAAKRVGERDGVPASKVFSNIQQRYHSDQKLWKEMYGIAYGLDLAPFDLVVNTEGFEKEDTYRVIHDFIRTKLSALPKSSH